MNSENSIFAHYLLVNLKIKKMSDLLTRIKCPMGCENSIFTETTKMISRGNGNLLLEGVEAAPIKVKSYTCKCCGNTFEIQESGRKDGKMFL